MANSSATLRKFTHALADNFCSRLSADAGHVAGMDSFVKLLRFRIARSDAIRSTGGVMYCRRAGHRVPFVSVAVGRLVGRESVTHYEYDSFKHSSLIGQIKDCSPQTAIAAITAHEFAHALQFWSDGNPGKPHGAYWRRLYLWLRETHVNHRRDWGANEWYNHVGMRA